MSSRLCSYRDIQLKLWYIFSAGRCAEKTIIALHSQLGRVPTSREAATVLGFATPDSLAKCLHDGQVCSQSYCEEYKLNRAFVKPLLMQ